MVAKKRVKRKMRLTGTDKQVLDEWVDAIMSGAKTLQETRAHVKGNAGKVEHDIGRMGVGKDDRIFLRGGKFGEDQRRDTIENRIRRIYATHGAQLGTQDNLVIPEERESQYLGNMSSRALVSTHNAYDRATKAANQAARERAQAVRDKAAAAKPGRIPISVRKKAGKSLAELARDVYGDPDQWRKIYRANKKRIGPKPSEARGRKIRLRLPGGTRPPGWKKPAPKSQPRGGNNGLSRPKPGEIRTGLRVKRSR